MKILIDAFSGIRPILPDHNLSNGASSEALNARLDNSAIRSIYQSELTAFTPATLTTAPNNIFKASYADDAIAWLVWDLDDDYKLPNILENRFNTIAAYEYPDLILPPEGGNINVIFTGAGVSQDVNGWYVSGIFTADVTTGPATQVVTTTAQVESSPSITLPETFLWTYVSGDVEITIDTATLQAPTFSATIAKPLTAGDTNTFSAVWKAAISDATPDTGERQITVSLTYHTQYIDDSLCVAVSNFMPYIGTAGDASNGSPVTVLNDDGTGVKPHTIKNVFFDMAECVEIYIREGLSLICSAATPMTLEDGSTVKAPHVLGEKVPVLVHGKFSWEKVTKVTHIEPQEVAVISCDNNVYAAGQYQGAYILSHNVDTSKP